MAYPIGQEKISALSNKLHSQLLNSYRLLIDAQTQLVNDNYERLLLVPLQNQTLQSMVSAILAKGLTSEIVARLTSDLNENVTAADINAYLVAFNLLASDTESNANLFILSFNSTTKTKQFVTPVAAGVKTVINNRISAILALVN